jgi:hypothetical protein
MDNMKEYNNLNPSELLHQFLDGELDITQEKQLFSELATNEELRTEMRELLAVRETVQNDLEAFTPPPESAGIIFGRVGLNHPVSGSTAGSAILRRNIFTSLVRRVWVPVAAAVVASLITAWFLTNEYDSRFANLEKKIPVVSSSENKNNNSSSFSGNASNNNEGPVRERKIYVYQKPLVIYRDNPELVASDNKPADEANSDERNGIASLEMADTRNLGLEQAAAGFKHQQSKLSFSTRSMTYKPMETSRGNRNKYSIVMRGMSAASFPSASVPLQGNAIFSNMSLGGYMDYTKSIKVGFEFGREPFGQEFVNIENAVGNVYEQNPLMFWGALGVSYEMPEPPPLIFGGRPYAGLLVGGTEQGPMGKFISGLHFISQDMGLGVFFGIEGSMLWYENQGRAYNTKKIGFTYGMSFQF